jgi:hypothetical protein
MPGRADDMTLHDARSGRDDWRHPMRKLEAILSALLLAGLLSGCVFVERPYHHHEYGYGYSYEEPHYWDRDRY